MNLEADASVYKQKAPTCNLHQLSPLRCPHWQSSPHQPLFPSSPTSKTKRAPFRLPPIQPYLTLPTQPKSTHSLTTHSPLTNQPTTTNLPKQALPHCPTCAHHSFTPPSPLPSRSPPSGGLPPNNQTHHHSQHPTSGSSTQMEKKRGVEGRDWPSVAPTPAPAWSLRRRAPHLNSPCLALSLPAPFFALLYVRC